MRLCLIAVSALLLAGCATNPSPLAPGAHSTSVAPAFTAAPLPAEIPSDLPRNARPLHYEIVIEPDADALSFEATSQVLLELYQPTDTIIMHAVALDIHDAQLLDADGALIAPLNVRVDNVATQTIGFAAPQTLAPGTYRIATNYTGTIGTQAAGLFALDYPDKRTGEHKRGLFTQFQAPDARRFAPMFDEPAYKATFDLTAIIPAGQMGLSNMPVASETDLGNGTHRVTFQTSPKMSSYLLYFGMGDFERASMIATDGTDVGIVAPAGSGEQTRFALEGLAETTPYFTEYFGLPYPLPKLDNITGPGQSQFFAAMENWGAILTFEEYLLDDPAITSPAQRQNIYQTQVHEVAHQWFGNIVTMAWWDDLWLNEGFASWLDTKVTHHFRPEWHRNITRVSVRERAMGLDALASSHPVIQPISTVAETTQAFDTITYAKGEAVIAMLEAYAGEDVWKAGLQDYLAANAYGNTTSNDLWLAMEAAGAQGLTQIANDFTRQQGVPMVLASDECVDGQTRLSLTQSEFTRDRREDPRFSAGSWQVPMLIAVEGQEAVRHVLKGEADLTLPGCGSVIVNGGQLGYFRTHYAADMAEALADNFASFSATDQLGLLRDAQALAEAGYAPLAQPMALLASVPGDANPLVAQLALGSWAGIYGALGEDYAAERAQIAKLANTAFAPRLAQLGYDPTENEALVDTNLRATLIGALGQMDHAPTLAQARSRFALLANDPRALDGPLKHSWLALAATNATPAEWEVLASLARASSSTVERQAYFEYLGATKDEALARAALELALNGEAGTVSAAIITKVAGRHPLLAFDFVMENRAAVRALVDNSGWQGYIAGLARNSTEPELLVKLRLLAEELPADEAAPINRAIDAFRVRMVREAEQEERVLEWLAGI